MASAICAPSIMYDMGPGHHCEGDCSLYIFQFCLIFCFHIMNDTNLSSFAQLKGLKGLRIVHLNCCSLVHKIDEVRNILIRESDVDVLCISESWLKPHHNDGMFAIPNYTLYRLDRECTSRSGTYIHGGGLAGFVKSHITS